MKTNLLLCLLSKINKTFNPNGSTRYRHSLIKNRNAYLRNFFLVLSLVFFSIHYSQAQTNTWDGSVSANWNTAGNWSLNVVPTAAHDVVIPNGITGTITVNTAGVCKSLTINGGATTNTLSINSGTLTVTNDVVINAGTGLTTDKLISVGAGTLTCTNVLMAATTNDNQDCEISVSTGTVNISGSITMNGTSGRNAIRLTGSGTLNAEADIIGGSIVGSASSNVYLVGGIDQLINTAASFYNITVNKNSASNIINSAGNAWTVNNNLTVNAGILVLEATDANYTISNDLVIAANGTVTHSVSWNTYLKQLTIGGNIEIDGLFNYTARSHVQMSGSGTKYLRTGPNASAAFSILTLLAGNYYASGTLRVNDNFWAMYNSTGSFHTNNQTVYANASLLNAGGTVYIDGGILNVTAGFQVGNSSTSGTVNFSSGTLNTDALTLGSGLLTGNFMQSGGTANISANLTITLTGGYTCSNAPVINIRGNWINNDNNAAFVPAGSTVNFTNTLVAQNIQGTSATQTFNNITVNKAGQQLNAAGSLATLNLTGNMTLSAGTLDAGTATAINIAGDWINNGAVFNPGLGTVTFNGSAAQSVTGTTNSTFNNLALNNSNGLTLNAVDVNLTGGANTLTFTNGKISTGVNKLILGNSGTILGAAATRYVNGNLQMGVATGSPSKTFAIGNGAGYAPVTVNFVGVTVAGNLLANTTGTDHPNITSAQIDETASVNRYWSLINNGIVFATYNTTFNFLAADVDVAANTAIFAIGNYSGSWTYPTMGAKNPTNTSATGLTAFGDFAIGETGAAAPTMNTQPINQNICSGISNSITAKANSKPGSAVQWEISSNGGANYSTLVISSPYSQSTSTVSGITTSTLTINPVSVSMNNNMYRAVFTNSRGNITSNAATYTVTLAGTADAGPALNNICKGGTSDPLGGSIGGSATSGTWSTPSGGTFNPNATTLNATWTPPAAFTGTATLTLTANGGACGPVTASKTQVVVNIATASAGAALAAICQGSTSAALGGTVGGTATGGVWSTAAGGTFNPNANTLNATWTPPPSFTGTAVLTLTTTGSVCVATASKNQVVNPVPTVDAGSALSDICQGGTSAPLGGTIGGAATGATWTTASGGTFTPNATTLNATWTPPTAFTGTATLTLTSSGGLCAAATGSKTQLVNPSPGNVTVSPSSATLCEGSILALSVTGGSSTSATSGTISAAIPNNSATGVTHTLAIAGIPAGATVNSISITFNATHPKVSDLVMNIKAPNGNILNMVNRQGGTGVNFTNTVVSSTGTNTFIAGTAPFTGTYAADAVTGVGATGFMSNVADFASLTSVLNGNWTIIARDAASSNTGTLTSWTISINYNDPISWTPVTDLYKDAAATLAYAGENLQTVYVKPSSGGTPVYTATTTNSSNCSKSQNINLTVNAKPVVTIAADYCYGGGKIQLTANSTPAGTSWLWNNGATTQSILVDVAGNFEVTVTSAAGCIGTGATTVAIELITNGNFSAGNTGFSSAYGYASVAVPNTMYPENLYTVYNDPTYTHGTFFGRDHTSNTGNFMIINGSGSNPPPNVWQETVPVQPNTDYYFSAWAISLNSVGPYANLQFKVNGTQVGTTTGALLPRPHNNNPPYNWTRFYGIWNSGSATSALISIVDLELASGGNDFGLDDISFATLSTFIKLNDAPGTDSQTVCKNYPINNITYTVGSGIAGPTVSGLPPGVTSAFNGLTLTISGSPTAAGTYNFSIVTTGTCNPATAYGRIIVTEETITRTSAPATTAQTICINSPVTTITYSVGGSATGATVTGLPTGVTGSYSAGVFTISGTPTIAGVFSYTVTTSGSCSHSTATGTITVNQQSITLSSAVGTNAQTKCINTAITTITYSITGTATNATASGLPTGVNGSNSAGVFTISGTPTVAGVFNYTVTTSGSCSPVATATGSLTVTQQSVGLTSAAGTNAQTKCINTAITPITYAVTGTATNATVSGLPTGVTGSYSAGVFTISGTPTIAGLFNYTVTTSGSCSPVATATGSITVTQQSISLTSVAGTDVQTKCINTSITAITYAVTGSATSATVTGLPTGVTGSYSAGVFTISGTPTIAGVFNYSITTSGTCSPAATATGSITVTQQVITLTSAAGTNAQTICQNTAITAITYAVNGSATNATVTGLPAGITGGYSAGTFTISGIPTVPGAFAYTITTSGTCTAATATGTINVTAASVGGTIASASVCSGANGNVTLAGNIGSIIRWESSNDGGATWNNIINTTNTQAYNNITQALLFRALVQNAGCSPAVYSNTAKVGIHNLWTGVTSTDWNTGSNWSDDQVPTSFCPDVVIPLLTAPNVYPQLTSGTATIHNLVIYPSATMSISNATLQVSGTITNNGTLIASNGTVELNGTSAAQSIAGSMFSGNTIKNLKISNSNGVSFSGINDTMKISGLISFGTSNAMLNTNNNLTLLSNAAGTASVGDLTGGGLYSGNNIVGNATVERYIPNHPKAWQLLAAPTTGQTVKNAWQEGNAPLSNSTHPGYGTIITSNIAGAVALGFDVYTPSGPTMKTYNPLTNGWDGIASPSIQIANKRGYMFFVRGDRSVTTSAALPTPTVLRTTGKLYTTGADAPPSTTVLAGKLESIGNPYASPIDFRLITKTAAPDVADAFYVWDPLLTNSYNGLGGYQTISAANGWKPIPGGTANYDANVANPIIQSGQAFMVNGTGAGGTVSFTESCKVNGSASVNRELSNLADRQFLKVNLYTSTGVIADGNVVTFDRGYSKMYDADDALKIPNGSENLGISRSGKILALEARSPLEGQDTIFYTLGNMRKVSYRLTFKPENLGNTGLTAQLVDKYLATSTAITLTDSSAVNFVVNTDAGSYAADRFSLVFRTPTVLPVNITHISATRNSNKSITVNWKSENEINMQQYDVERSKDGRSFDKINQTAPRANNSGAVAYDHIDENPLPEENFYRVKAISQSGMIQYSSIVKVASPKTTGSINVYPNPVVDKKLNIQFTNQPKGNYAVQLINTAGQVIFKTNITVDNNSTVHTLYLPQAIAAGNYQLKLVSADGNINIQQVMIK